LFHIPQLKQMQINWNASAKHLFLILFGSVFFQSTCFGWGQIGHRSIGKIAESHLSPIAKANLEKLMGFESLAQASTWMDEVRSDSTYDYMKDWHWVSIPDSSNYESSVKNPNGDVISTIERILSELENGKEMTLQQEHNYIRILCHLIGDIHQPLHVGNGNDRGDHSTYRERQEWQSQGVRVWARESMALRAQVYDLPEDKMLSYKYVYKNWSTVMLRINQAGVRLAGILNKIYG